MTTFLLPRPSSVAQSARSIKVKFNVSKSHVRSFTADVSIGDMGECKVDLVGKSVQTFACFTVYVQIELNDISGRVLHIVKLPALHTLWLLGFRLRGRVSHQFRLNTDIIKMVRLIRVNFSLEPELAMSTRSEPILSSKQKSA